MKSDKVSRTVWGAYRQQIIDYLRQQNLSVKKFVRCMKRMEENKYIVLDYPEVHGESMLQVLIVQLENGKLRFEQTEYTQECLGKDYKVDYEDIKPQIIDYIKSQNLCVDKFLKCSKSWGPIRHGQCMLFAILAPAPPNYPLWKSLPVALWIYATKDGLEFEQTEWTISTLGKES